VEFVAYTEDVVNLFDRHKVNHHLYADDQHIYLDTKPGLASTGLTRLVDCFSELSVWCTSRRLHLNAAKTELIWFGSWAMLHHLISDNRSLSIGSVIVNSVNFVRDLGVLLDSELTMKQHINHVVSIGYHHLRRLRQLRFHITQDAMKQLVCSLIMSRIDYCNSILIGLLVSSTAPLQRIQKCCRSASNGSTCSWPCYLCAIQSSLASNSLSNSVLSRTHDVLHPYTSVSCSP